MNRWDFFAGAPMWSTRGLEMHHKVIDRLYVLRMILPTATMTLAVFNFLINFTAASFAEAFKYGFFKTNRPIRCGCDRLRDVDHDAVRRLDFLCPAQRDRSERRRLSRRASSSISRHIGRPGADFHAPNRTVRVDRISPNHLLFRA
jgi:hypothetical protein